MSIKSKAAQLVPKAAVKKEIAKGNYRGDDWGDVSKVIFTVCEITHKKDGSGDFKFNGKVVGWFRPNGQSWIDDEAYVEMRKAYKIVRKAQILSQRRLEKQNALTA
jgi:hypothetical protein